MPISTEVEVNLTMKDNFSGAAEKLYESFQKQVELQKQMHMDAGNPVRQLQGFDQSVQVEAGAGSLERVSRSFEQMSRLSGQFGAAMGATFDKLVHQGRGFESVLFDLQRELGRMAVRAMASGIFDKVFGGLGNGMDFLPMSTPLAGFADGGRINAFQTAMVGERGPELFRPAVSGDIVPSERLRGDTVVNHFHFNVDAPAYMANQGQIAAEISRAMDRGRRNR